MGVDNSFLFSKQRNEKREVVDLYQAFHFYDDAEKNLYESTATARFYLYEFVSNSYQLAEKCSKKDETIRIYNEICCGKSDDFERIDLYAIVSK